MLWRVTTRMGKGRPSPTETPHDQIMHGAP